MASNRSEATEFVIRALADDYESVESLAKYCQIPRASRFFTQPQIIEVLLKLMANGHVESCLYSEVDQKYISSLFVIEDVNSYWFRLTNNGKELLSDLLREKR